jgi:CheY-specific phosphatase CheX
VNDSAQVDSSGSGVAATTAMAVTEGAIQDALREAMTDVLESMFFMECGSAEWPGGESGKEGGKGSMAVEIAFEGDRPGRFSLWLAAETATVIAADFLGEDAEELNEVQRGDVALEMANMICGSALSRLGGRARFRLGSPRIVPGCSDCAERTRQTVETGHGRLMAAIQLEGWKCQAGEFGS